MAINTLFIANRGEIAVRIIRAARDLGIRTVQAYSAADEQSLAVELADEAVAIGPPAAAKSYLNRDNILSAAKSCGACAVHPGYGFLAENADFADAVQAAGMIFVGPDGETIRKMGDKASARRLAKLAGVTTVPGSDGEIGDLNQACLLAGDLGYPVMIKASAGGGGRGIRIANDETELRQLAPQAASEAKAAFGAAGLYLEKVISRARHIEVQIMGDGKDVVHFYERECSLQRRRQKVWEEAPCVHLSPATRRAICESAVKLARAVNYRGAGTVEYLYDDRHDEIYFIEMNTRIQVEHPVTEFVTGHDLLCEMILIAGGAPLSLKQGNISLSGHAIEVRINAEDPSKNFMPFPGVVADLRIPGGPAVRFDHMLYSGYQIPPFYDSLLGKLIVHGKTREQAINRLKRALHELRIEGLKTTAPLFRALLEDEDVIAGATHTKWLEPWLEKSADKISALNGEAL